MVNCTHEKTKLVGGIFQGNLDTMRGDAIGTLECEECGKWIHLSKSGKFILDDSAKVEPKDKIELTIAK